MGIFNKMFGKTKEKVEKVAEEAKVKVINLTETANKFISDGNGQMKVITIIVVAVGISSFVSNCVSIGSSIYMSKTIKEPKIINNITIQK